MALFNSSMFDTVARGLLPTMPSQWNGPAPQQMPEDWKNAADYLWQLDRATATNPMTGNQTFGFGRAAPASDTFDQRFGSFQPPAQAPSLPPMPQAPPEQAALPSGSYTQGGTNVPVFGQAPAQPEQVSAQRRAVPQGPLAPAAAPPAIESSLMTGASDKWKDLLGRLNPEIGARNDAKKAQAETARGMYEVYIGQGFDPKVAAAKAVIAARNPKVLEEVMKPYANMEQRIANRPGATATGEYTDFLTKKNAAEKAGTVHGESQAQAQIDLPGAVSTAKEQIRLIGELRDHAGRKQYGWHDVLGKAPLVPSTKGYDADNLLSQIKSGAFMTAFQTLKGGGQITEKEGTVATAAIARMDRATSKAEFEKALDDYEGVIKLGIDRASQKAGAGAPFGFKGNDGWQTLQGGVRIRERR